MAKDDQKISFEDGSDGPRLNPEVIRNAFKKADFMACLIELIKNSIDAFATNIWLETTDKRIFRVVDNGCGMDAARRTAYLRAGYSTGDGSTSAKFGTGARMLPVSFEAQVSVMTVSKAEPNTVYICEFTPDQLMSYYINQYDIRWRSVRKTRTTWPHEHETGVDVTYTFANPRRTAIKRGEDLMRRLTNRLDIGLVESDMFRVDGQRLPKKQYAPNTRPLIYALQNDDLPEMGFVKLEFYRLADPASGELLMTDRTIGEVSFRNKFVALLPESVKSKVPPLFMQSGVSGLITADFLNKYVTHQRDEYQKVEDDERVKELMRILASVQAEVAEALGIRLKQVDEKDAEGRKEVTAFLSNLNDLYSNENVRPPAHSGNGTTGEGGGSKSRGGTVRQGPHFKLDRRQFEPGEEIVATLIVPNGSTADYEFFYNEARAKGETRVTEGRVRMIAESVGTGKLKARHRTNGSWIEARYEIVQQRWFHIMAEPEIGIDHRTTVRAYNIDKLPGGKIAWKIVDGPGSLTPGVQSRQATFVSSRVGFTTIRAYSQADPKTFDEREIEITRDAHSGPELYCIRGEFFTPRYHGLMGDLRFSKPVTIVRQEGMPHHLTFTPDEPGYVKALREGYLDLYLTVNLSHEFSSHFHGSETRDEMVRQWEVSRLAAEVAAEMLGAKKVQ